MSRLDLVFFLAVLLAGAALASSLHRVEVNGVQYDTIADGLLANRNTAQVTLALGGVHTELVRMPDDHHVVALNITSVSGVRARLPGDMLVDTVRFLTLFHVEFDGLSANGTYLVEGGVLKHTGLEIVDVVFRNFIEAPVLSVHAHLDDIDIAVDNCMFYNCGRPFITSTGHRSFYDGYNRRLGEADGTPTEVSVDAPTHDENDEM